MSYITFASSNREVELRGPERHWMGHVCTRVAMSVLSLWDTPDKPCWTRRLLPSGHYLLNSRRYADDFKVWFAVDGREMVHPVTGAPVNAFSVLLNTAMRLGGDEVKLMARLHGQCEIHAYILPTEAPFVARLIESGLESGLYRQGMGWLEVVQHLRNATAVGTRSTTVLSYSVTDSFGVEVDENLARWWPEADRRSVAWERAVAGLDPSLAITEEGFRSYSFGNGETLMALERACTTPA